MSGSNPVFRVRSGFRVLEDGAYHIGVVGGRSIPQDQDGGRVDPLDLVQGSGSRVQGSGFGVQGSGLRVQGSGFRVQGSGFRVQGSGFRVLLPSKEETA